MKTIATGVFLLLVFSAGEADRPDRQPYKISIDWGKTASVSKLSPSLYVVNSPKMRRNSPIHDPVHAGLKALNVDYLRYMSYFTFPKLSVAELYPPKDGKTSWDFSLMDPLVLDIFKVSEGRPVMMTFNTVPAWMFKRSKPVSYPADPDALVTESPQGTALIDTSGQQLADYYQALKMIADNFGPGDAVLQTDLIGPAGYLMAGALESAADLAAQSYRKPDGKRKILLINKRNKTITATLPETASSAQLQTVDATTGGNPPRVSTVRNASMELSPFSISVVTLQ